MKLKEDKAKKWLRCYQKNINATWWFLIRKRPQDSYLKEKRNMALSSCHGTKRD